MSISTIAIAVVALAAFAAVLVWRAQVREAARQAVTFVGEVNSEMRKVTWPDRQQLRSATGVIILFVVIVAIIIGLMDVILQLILVKWLPAWLR
ncbi:MAG TPA: preprotein translocase subunit SecE [Gemmatimonadales bacterium]|nr:preprotein translocase subunit SecE [Gemmatimonadales bacterium]